MWHSGWAWFGVELVPTSIILVTTQRNVQGMIYRELAMLTRPIAREEALVVWS